MRKINLSTYIIVTLFFTNCGGDDSSNDSDTSGETCTVTGYTLSSGPSACTETLSIASSSDFTDRSAITANNIPNHTVGLFGNVSGSLNPNAITAQNSTYNITTTPVAASSFTSLLGTTGPDYSFGILLNGVELDPVAAEPFPHSNLGFMDPNVNWEWNLEALNVEIGLDCNYAHVQPTGKYHYHGTPTGYLTNTTTNQMTLIGYAADGFPIYYKYAYETATDSSSPIITMTSSYQLKSGERPGNGVTAPCGTYDGGYSADYEFVSGLGTLDEANGRTGVTPEYPDGTYYYIITDEFPSIPRYFRGTPSNDFKIGA